MERNINYTVDFNQILPSSPQFAGVQGEHNATSITFSFTKEFEKKLNDLPNFYEYTQFRIDFTDSLGQTIYGEVKDISQINEPFYLTRSMTKQGGNATAVLKITGFVYGGAQKEFYTGVMRFYFESCPSVILSDDDQGSVLSPIVNQARIYRNEAYDCAKVSTEAEERVKNMTEENRALTERTQNNVDNISKASQMIEEFEERLENSQEIINECQEAADLARDAASGVVTIEQNRQTPLKISVMTNEEYAAATRPSPDGVATLDIIEDEILADLIYPVGSIYMSVNATDPAILFGGNWERIKDSFLLSCGDTYSAGEIGGEAQHTMTVDEMPKHTHSVSIAHPFEAGGIKPFVPYSANNENYVVGNYDVVQSAGNSQPHNNMPPYLAVYMWQRVS